MKRVLSILLAAVLLLSMIPVGAVSFAFSAKAEVSVGDNDVEIDSSDWWESVEEWDSVFHYTTANRAVTITGVKDQSISGELIIPDTIDGYPVTAIGNSAFWRCDGLTSVVIPDSVKSIDGYAFSQCRSLKSVTLPRGLTTVREGMFNGCESLTSLYMPKSVTTIEGYAFSGCYSLAEVFYDGATYNGYETDWSKIYYAVYDDMTDSTRSMLEGAARFYVSSDCSHRYGDDNICDLCGEDKYFSGYSFTTVNDLATITFASHVMRGKVVLPTFLDGYPLTTVDFWSAAYITELVIPEGVTAVGADALTYGPELRAVTLPATITSIGADAFSNFPQLTDVYYGGTEADRAKIAFGGNNGSLETAVWHYAEAECTAHAYGDDNLCDTCGADMYLEYYTYTVESGEATLTGVSGDVSGNIVLPSTLGGYPVTKIGYDAFYGCNQITAVTIPNGVTSIGDWAFSDCTALESVSIPDGVMSIGNYAFYWCIALAEAVLPDSVIDVGGNAFCYCTALTNLRLSARLISMGSYAFSDCYSLKSLTLPLGMTSIGYGAFSGAQALTEVTVPETVTSIEDNAFFGCVVLKSLTLPQSVTSIGSEAFNYCDTLTEVHYGGSTADRAAMTTGDGNDPLLNATWYYAVTVCNHITTTLQGKYNPTCTQDGYTGDIVCVDCGEVITTGESIPSLGHYTTDSNICDVCGEDVFLSYYKYTVNAQNKAVLTKVDPSVSGKVILPSKLGGYPIAGIAGHAFAKCEKLTEVVIPDGPTYIGAEAFMGCTQLRSVTIPSSVRSIVRGAFSYCYSLENVELPSVLTAIAENVFFDCDALVSVSIPQTVKSIGASAFANCDSLVSVKIPSWVNKIGDGAFSYCYSLTTLELPDSVKTLGASAFEGCTALTSLVIPNGVTSIETYTFSACTALQSVTIPDSVTSIGRMAFYRCEALSDVHYGGSAADRRNIAIESEGNDCLENAKWHCALVCEHLFDNACDTDCNLCGEVRETTHVYEEIVVPPTYFEEGYTLYLCGVCGDAYRDDYQPALPRQPLQAEYLTLEYTTAYYKGQPLTPAVTLKYQGQVLDAKTELKLTYAENDKVGTASVTAEGINRFTDTVVLTFDIVYERIPAPLVNVIAQGEIGKISLSWGKAAEVTTTAYRIYRKAQGDETFALLTTINGRDTLTYEDTAVEKDETYFYYVTGVGEYGAESTPSAEVAATVLRDVTEPIVLKITPNAASVLSGKVTLSATVSDNVGVVRVRWSYSIDNGENWKTIGNATNSTFRVSLDTVMLDSTAVKVQAVAYDAEGNVSAPKTADYTLDNEGPEAVTGLSAVALSSKLTLAWADVQAEDAAYFILQQQTDGKWATVAQNITTLGYTVTRLQPDTAYTFRVACVDARGNVGAYSDAFTAQTAADVTAPVITAQNPAPARYNTAIAFNATAKDDCGIAKIEIFVSPDRKTWTKAATKEYTDYTYSRTYHYSLNTADYAEGSLFVQAVATDFAGNVSDTGDTAPLTEYIVDRTAPKAPQNVTAVGNDGYITVAWSMGSENDIGRYNLYRASSADGPYQCIAQGLSAVNYHDRNVTDKGVYYYTLEVTDSCGNVSARSAAVSAVMAKDTQKPQIVGIGSTYDNKVSAQLYTISVTASDNNTLSQVVVEYATTKSPDYTRLMTVTDIASYYKTFSVKLPLEGLSDGDSIFLRVYAEDTAGLRSDVVGAKYTVDITAPTVTAYTAAINGNVVTLNWTDGGEADLSGFYIYRSADGVNFTRLGSRTARADGKYTFTDTVSGTQDSTYIYKVEGTDGVGNTASWTREVDYVYKEPVRVNNAPFARATVPFYMTVDVEERFDGSLSSDDMAVVSYFWDLGDGRVSTEQKPVVKYSKAGTYTVSLTVADNEGETSTVITTVEVRERETIGRLNVRVVDENNKSLPYVPVYFDLGSEEQTVITTDASGVATAQLPAGTHVIGMYATGYLPVKKETVVLANATRTVTLTTVEEELVTGNFEVTRMTFDEIVAAGIDVYDPANQNVYSATVRVTYGSSAPLTLNYVRNDNTILSYGVTDQNGKPVDHYTNANGEKRKITSVTYIPRPSTGSGSSGTGGSSGSSDVVAIMDIPASASYLKEFFDVRLHIVNNAAADFVLENNEVVLNVPEGMTLMNQVSGGYAASDTVHVKTIRGQETATIAWVLRGDTMGEYHLSADFTGTLAEFDEIVTARFETAEPIKVYGLDGVKFRVLAADEIHNDALYFQAELENTRDIDIYMPNIGVTDKVSNVTASVLGKTDEEDFLSDAYILNAYIQTENGQKNYLAVTYDANGRATTNVEVLAPGQKIVYEYVAYNASNFDGIGYFENAIVTEFEGMLENIEVGTYHKDLYSFTDYSQKLSDILGGDPALKQAYDTILDGDYYYVGEAEKWWHSILEDSYQSAAVVLSGDISHLTQTEQRNLIKSTILNILSDSSVIKAVEDRAIVKYTESVNEMIKAMESKLVQDYGDGKETGAEIAGFLAEVTKDSKELAVLYKEKGYDALVEAFNKRLAGYAIGAGVEAASLLTACEDYMSLSDAFGYAKDAVSALMNVLNQTERDAACYAILKLQCNAELSAAVLDALIAATEKDAWDRFQDAVDLGLLQPSMGLISLGQLELNEKELLHVVALEMRRDLDKTMEEYSKTLDGIKNTLIYGGETAAKIVINGFVQKALGATPYGLIVAVFTVVDSFFGIGDYVKQQDSLKIYNEITKALDGSLRESVTHRNTKADFLSMVYLRALCEMRLAGESVFKGFMNNYTYGKYGFALSEDSVVKKINRLFDTEYTLMDEWWDEVQYEILRARDLMFNIEYITDVETPRAPVVTLDYQRMQTVQSFSSQYEYCFADGAWRPCTNAPIAFTVGVTPSVMRVRQKAGNTNLAGNITTVKIFAQKELSKLITVRFDGVNYYLDGLSAARTYQVFFTDEDDAAPHWSLARTVFGSADTVTVSGAAAAKYVIIRSCHNPSLQETASLPLTVTVAQNKPLALTVDGGGTVTQSAASGCYFGGETIDLLAVPFADSQFVGWYIGGECVSTDRHYVAEMSDDLAITARFTGATVVALNAVQSPQKQEYNVGEPMDLNGLRLVASYSDGSEKEVSPQAAWFESNVVGETMMVVTYSGYTARFAATIVSDCKHKYEHACDTHCESCGAVRATEHSVVEDAAVPPTCTETGLTAGEHCDECGEVLTAQQTVAKLSHAFQEDVCTVCGAHRYYTYTVTDGRVTVTDVSVTLKGDVVIPATLGGYPVTALGDNAFRNCRNITTLTIPAGIERIGTYAFKDCTALQTVYYNAANCSVMGAAVYPAFGGCTALTTVYIGKDVNALPIDAFRNAATLATVYLTKSTKVIGRNAFHGCTALGTVYYVGSASDFAAVDVRTYNEPLKNASFVFESPCFDGHDWTAVCDARCDVCGEVRETEHRQVTEDAAVTPTCTENGLTAGSHCALCGNVITAQEVLEAYGHRWDAGEVLTPPTDDASGVKRYTCTVCGDTKTVEITNAYVADGCYYVSGVKVPNAGLVRVEDAYYYVGDGAKVKTGRYAISRLNDLPIEKGIYYFFADGKMNLARGVYDGYYFDENGKLMPYAGLIQWNGAKYYVNNGGKVNAGGCFYISNLNGLLPKACLRTFYPDGRMLEETRIYDVDGYYYENGARTPYAGMVLYDGRWYYVNDGGAYVKNKVQVLVNVNNSGLAKNRRCYFDAEGHMVKNTVVNGAYYGADGAAPSYAGVVTVNGAYYYVSGTHGALAVSKRVVITEEKTNGLLAAGVYTADANGKLTAAA